MNVGQLQNKVKVIKQVQRMCGMSVAPLLILFASQNAEIYAQTHLSRLVVFFGFFMMCAVLQINKARYTKQLRVLQEK